MIWQPDEQLAEDILTEMMDEIQDESRKDSHPSVTDLIYCLTKTFYDSRPSRVEPSRKTKLYFTTGLGLERSLLTARQSKPILGKRDGIYYHCDSHEDGQLLLELKTTRMGPNKVTPDSFSEGWLKQIKAYCYAQNSTKVNYVVLHVIQPELQAWRLEFTQEELQENWDWLVERKQVWMQALETNTAPEAFKFNMPWECKECSYKLICDMMATGDKLGISFKEF